MTPARFLADIAEGPAGGQAWWVTADDGLRLRVGGWQPAAARGTVLLLPGRTEYIEKYGRSAADLAALGFGTFAIDWRGQGLSQRLLPDPATGHVERFADYQRDLRAMVAAAEALRLPRPWHLLGHSMGGCIGLRALHEGLPVETAAFSAPMWDIVIPPLKRPFAWVLSSASRPIGLGHRYPPGTTESRSYVMETTFEENLLTGDAEQFAYMQRQIEACPELSLGGPSMAWLNEALREMRALRAISAPRLPAYCAVGSEERIVTLPPIRALMARWPGGALEIYEGAGHEIPMERAAIRRRFFAALGTLFGTGRAPGAPCAAAG